MQNTFDETPTSIRKSRTLRDEILNVRVTKKMKTNILELANKRGQTIADFLRYIIVQEQERELEREVKTGLNGNQ